MNNVTTLATGTLMSEFSSPEKRDEAYKIQGNFLFTVDREKLVRDRRATINTTILSSASDCVVFNPDTFRMKNSGSKKAFVAKLLFLGLAQAQWIEPPPTTADPNTIKDCTWWHEASATDTCDSVAALYGLSEEQLIAYVGCNQHSFYPVLSPLHSFFALLCRLLLHSSSPL